MYHTIFARIENEEKSISNVDVAFTNILRFYIYIYLKKKKKKKEEEKKKKKKKLDLKLIITIIFLSNVFQFVRVKKMKFVDFVYILYVYVS